MSRDWRGRFGALQEREFRLLFSATTITTAGDRLAGIALAFAVIDIGTATDLGLVFAARQGTQALVVLFGGVLSDRLPRNRVLAGAALVQGVSQVGTAAVVLGGAGGVWAIVALQAAWGIGQGVVIPAEVGLVPQTVSAARLQQANALQGLSRNVVGVLGPAVGGLIVVATSPGIALAVDAVSFFVCAELLRRIRVAGRLHPDGQTCVLRRAPRRLAGVHVAHLAVGIGDPLRSRKPRTRRLAGPGSRGRRGRPGRRRPVVGGPRRPAASVPSSGA